MARRRMVNKILSANRRDMKKGSMIMRKAEMDMMRAKKKLLSARRVWLKKAVTLKRQARRYDSPRLAKAAMMHKRSAVVMPRKIMQRVGKYRR